MVWPWCVKGVDVWSLKRVKVSIILSLILDVVQVVLYGTSMSKDRVYTFF